MTSDYLKKLFGYKWLLTIGGGFLATGIFIFIALAASYNISEIFQAQLGPICTGPACDKGSNVPPDDRSTIINCSAPNPPSAAGDKQLRKIKAVYNFTADTCGYRNCEPLPRRTSRLLGDAVQIAATGQYPWMLSIVPVGSIRFPPSFNLTYYYEHVCGGSLIAPRWGLTAAHCCEDLTFKNGPPLPDPPYTLAVSRKDYSRLEYFKTGNIKLPDTNDFRLINACFKHPKYVSNNQTTWGFDTALVRWDEPWHYFEEMDPNLQIKIITRNFICLPIQARTRPLNFEFSGWGKIGRLGSPRSLRWAHIGPRTAYWLQAYSLADSPQDYCASPYKNAIRVCRSAGQRATGMCRGDSGSPLVNRQPGSSRFIQHGIASNVEGRENDTTWESCVDSTYNHYADVFNISDWLTDTVERYGGPG